MSTPSAHAPRSFDRSAGGYDELVAPNRAGAERLVAALPPGPLPVLLDVACGTGFASLAAIRERGVRRVVGVDASAAMLDVFRERLTAHPGVEAELRACDVLDMGVDDASVDLVLCAMAIHWFRDRPAAVRAMARTLRPGGALGILAPGPRHDRPTVDLLLGSGDRLLGRLAESILTNEIDLDTMRAHLVAADLEPLDLWTETRERLVPPEAIAGRLDAVASHLWDEEPAPEREAVTTRLHALFAGAAGADGRYRYRFVKTYAVARAR